MAGTKTTPDPWGSSTASSTQSLPKSQDPWAPSPAEGAANSTADPWGPAAKAGTGESGAATLVQGN